MQAIKIGKNIAQKRREKGITQEELANYLGISKPAVSKWESGQSYPDILLLPVIAAYFDISIDELLGYSPQLTKEEINKLYRRLSNDFATQPFDEVLAECQDLIKKYYSCWRLLFSMSSLLINHAIHAPNPEQIPQIYEQALKLLQRVEKESNDVILGRQAVTVQAACYLALNQPALAIDLLQDIAEIPMDQEILLAKAYQMKNLNHEAQQQLQIYIHQRIAGLFSAIPNLLSIQAQSSAELAQYLGHVLALGQAFDMENSHPGIYLNFYVTAAYLFAIHQDAQQTLAMLDACITLLRKEDSFPIRMKSNAFFTLLDDYLEKANLDAEMPRNENAIKQDLKNIITHNPIFTFLHQDKKYQQILKQLDRL